VPCCTLIAFVLSQLGLGAGAARMRFTGIPFIHADWFGGWKAVALAAIAGFEIVLASAVLPLVFAAHGRSNAADSFQHAWHICSVDLGALDQVLASREVSTR
jgi:hypothetical protein